MRAFRVRKGRKRIEREETPNANRFCQLPKNTDRHLIQRSVFGFYRNLQTLFARRDVLLFFLTLPWRAFLFDRSDADDRGAASEASATLGDRGVRPASRGGCGRGAERVRPRPGLRPVWSAFGGARGATWSDAPIVPDGLGAFHFGAILLRSRRTSRRGADAFGDVRHDGSGERFVGFYARCGLWRRRRARHPGKGALPRGERVRRPRARRGPVRSRGDGHPARARGRGDDVHVGRAPRA